MATLNYVHVLVYTGTGTGATATEAFNTSGIIDDGEADNTTFETLDTVIGLSGMVETYRGTTEIDGVTWPVFTVEGLSVVYMTQTSVNPPDTLTVADNATYCFAAGTLIATPMGEVAVEALGIGDLVLTAEGRAVPVKWLGWQSVAPCFQNLRLIRLAAGALGDGLPRRDLTVTADHALMIDGLLINAGALVNGTSIAFVPLSELGDSYTVYHIETEDHDVILAEGTPAETYIDYAGRRVFHNYAEYVALYGEDRAIVENPAPRITSARHLPARLRARLGHGLAA